MNPYTKIAIATAYREDDLRAASAWRRRQPVSVDTPVDAMGAVTTPRRYLGLAALQRRLVRHA
jgi:hypothetical protein